jgi:hypothetical protein
MATAQQIRDLITQTTSGSVRLRVPREVRDEVCRYAARRRRDGAAWAVIARETGLDVRKLQRWGSRAHTGPGAAGLHEREPRVAAAAAGARDAVSGAATRGLVQRAASYC